MTTARKFPSLPVLRLVHGGALSEAGAASEQLPANVKVCEISKTEQEDRLRRAISRLMIDELGQTVNETLREMCEKLDEYEDEHFARCLLLAHSLELRGLKFRTAASHLDLDSEGYLMLVDAKHLLVQHPELAVLNPENHDLMTLGEIPLLMGAASVAQNGAVLFSLCRLKPEQLTIEASSSGFFDARGSSRSAQQSNRLRHAILALQLDVGRSVKEVLSELRNLPEVKTHKQRDRAEDLLRSLESAGLKFKEVKKELGLPIASYIWLARPDWLLGRHPELANLHPVAWPALRIA